MNDQTVPKPERALQALGASFLLAVLNQYLFYGKMPGISCPIFVSLFYVYVLYFARDRLRKPTAAGYIWLGAIVLLSLTYALYANWLFFGLNLLVIPALILLHMTYMLSYKLPSWSGFGIIGAAAEHFFAQGLRHWATAPRAVRRIFGGEKLPDERKQVLIKVLIGLGISFPLLLIVTSLLSSADGVFHELLAEFPQMLERLSFGEGFARLLWIILLGLGMFGLLWGFIDYKVYTWNPKPELNMESGPAPESVPELFPEPLTLRVDPVIITTILTVINVVYVLFVSLQFSYLFGAWEGILPEGSTYAGYARSGFLELILVTSINFALLLLSLHSAGLAKGLLHKTVTILLYILVLCSVIMLYSAYSRLKLYEEAYGYTYIRFLVHVFMIFLGLLLVLAAVRISRVQFPLAQCCLALGLLSYVLVNYLGMDRIIAQQNIERYKSSGILDTSYLTRLSSDAVPLLIEFSEQENGMLDAALREKRERQPLAASRWPSFNVANFRAGRALEHYFAE
ncbi:DUF4153 domain-containing protein [Paenibacillus sp. S150]|uniref:DUF4153 domain-containing protein n=1 Tax=Paenibacillus sp. S150 TaxID=2749826 RepID=UPI001C599A7E|nr:DUF4173 domain-containing protein [Paenibacillus sp. S150]MBW4083083.1 DUF4173 domain-containing protein [Paenibacillus sp. S150]